MLKCHCKLLQGNLQVRLFFFQAQHSTVPQLCSQLFKLQLQLVFRLHNYYCCGCKNTSPSTLATTQVSHPQNKVKSSGLGRENCQYWPVSVQNKQKCCNERVFTVLGGENVREPNQRNISKNGTAPNPGGLYPVHFSFQQQQQYHMFEKYLFHFTGKVIQQSTEQLCFNHQNDLRVLRHHLFQRESAVGEVDEWVYIL